ncbi:hypothetical protein [Planctomicrobium piriforme]|uniref:Uncharacterized protein n=1 Tax=Planctomicrobium piriforme TaxID=1576369 RepID=A0A1I3CHI5_9PLAN|nr:hypothetical protein [Planctomicrobium piriforme]SFH74002.1 hypothetical protein SAMN05421753_102287 [Planctomicrobium piriforme]
MLHSMRGITKLCGILLPVALLSSAYADPAPPAEASLEDQRLAVMSQRIAAMEFTSGETGFPARLEATPLFRYDDQTRGYIDGTVWRLGKMTRPLAIVTAELHPRYGGSPRIVYDFLSLTSVPFVAHPSDVGNWSPGGSAVDWKSFPDAPVPAASAALRLAQMKQLSARFVATQDVEGQKVQLRLLPTPIDRYQPFPLKDRSDGAIFVLCNGRNPALILLIESDGETWSFGIGRLSLPSVLAASLNGVIVYHQQANVYGPGYNASNASVVIPGYEAGKGSVETE